MTGTENKPLNPQHGNNLNDMSSENGNTKSNNDKMALTKKYDQVADGRISKVRLAPAGCLTCRHRHKKCTREKPVCDTCMKSSYNCFWREPGTRFTDYKVKLIRNRCPAGEILQPNPLSSDNILSTQYHISDEENDDPMLANNWTEDDSNFLEEDSLITVAQKAVSITNAYMNSQEIQPMLNGEEIKRIKVKQEYLEGPINSQDESTKGHSRKEDGKEKENGEQDHEQDEEENNDSEDEQKIAFDHKKDDDSEDDDDDHGKSNGNYNGKLNVSGEDSSGKDNQNNESTNSDDADGSSQHRNTAIDSTQDLDTLKLLKFKTLLDMDQTDNLIINEGTLINMPSNKITNRGLSWYTRFLSSTPDTFDEDLRDAEGRLFPTIANEGLASLESQNKTQNIDSLSPACFLSHITNGELQRKSQTPTEQNSDNYNEADYEYLLNSAEPESKALVTGRRRRVQKKHPSNSHHPASKKKNMKKISKEMGAKLLLDAISKSRKTYDRCKLYQDGRRKLQSSKKHVNLSELPFYITQFMKQP